MEKQPIASAPPEYYPIVQQPLPCQIIVVQPNKTAPKFESYQEFCFKCQQVVQTRVKHKFGCCSILTLLFGLIIFAPIALLSCCNFVKDSRHFCPNCETLLATKKR